MNNTKPNGNGKTPLRRRIPPMPLASHVLLAVAALTAIATVVAATWAATVEIPGRNGFVTEAQVATIAYLLIGGLTVAAACAGLAEILRALRDNTRLLTRIDAAAGREAELREQAMAGQSPGITTAQGEAIQRLLEEIRDNVLLTDEERHARRLEQLAIERRQRTTQVEQALGAGLFHRARTLVQEMQQRLGNDEATRQLADRVERTASEAEARDVAMAAKQCEDLMGLTSWEQAVRIAQDLVGRHPQSDRARALLDRVTRERERHEQQHRTRLFNEVQRSVSERQWRRALVAARELMAAYPGTPEAQTIVAQKDTLETNAQIEHRKELETRYKEYCETRRYAEALALARQVISEYPNSPQAQVMRAQIAHLEKQVKGQA